MTRGTGTNVVGNSKTSTRLDFADGGDDADVTFATSFVRQFVAVIKQDAIIAEGLREQLHWSKPAGRRFIFPQCLESGSARSATGRNALNDGHLLE
jgi:hypothetical protein